MKKVMLSALLLSLPLLGYAQERFPSPEAAASAFAAAVAGKNETQLTALLGEMNFLPYRPCTLTLMRNRTITCKITVGRTG